MNDIDWIGSTKVDILRIVVGTVFVLLIGFILYFSFTNEPQVNKEIAPIISSNIVKVTPKPKPMTVNKYKTVHQASETYISAPSAVHDTQIPEVKVVKPIETRTDTVDDLNLQLKQLNTRLLKGLYEN